MNKNALRPYFKQRRRHLSNDFRVSAEHAMCHHWQESDLTPLRIGSYLATSQECPTAALHTLWWQQQKPIFIPLISQPGVFRELTVDSAFTKKTLGIDEPIDGTLVTADNLDILLIPLLAIDQHGYRLGYGGGFYDRLLARCVKQPLLIGLGFHEQLVDTLPHDPWDIPVDAFLSEQGWLFFSHS